MADQQRYQLIFEELMDKSEDGFIVIDTEGIITDINDKYCDFLGRKKENILGKPIEQIISTTSMYDAVSYTHLFFSEMPRTMRSPKNINSSIAAFRSRISSSLYQPSPPNPPRI